MHGQNAPVLGRSRMGEGATGMAQGYDGARQGESRCTTSSGISVLMRPITAHDLEPKRYSVAALCERRQRTENSRRVFGGQRPSLQARPLECSRVGAERQRGRPRPRFRGLKRGYPRQAVIMRESEMRSPGPRSNSDQRGTAGLSATVSENWDGPNIEPPPTFRFRRNPSGVCLSFFLRP